MGGGGGGQGVFVNKDIILCWVPSHVGIIGNEKADSTAKSALDLLRVRVGVPYTDFKSVISQYIFSTRQDDWMVRSSPWRVSVLIQAVQEECNYSFKGI